MQTGLVMVLKVCFVMFGTDRTGGNRVLFEVGNVLAERGHEIVFCSLGQPRHTWFKFNEKVKFIYPESRFSRLSASIANRGFKFLHIPYEVERLKILTQSIPKDYDFTVATFCFTAYAVYRADVGAGFYYIQHYEPFFFLSDKYYFMMAKETYYLPLKWIVNSSWANRMLEKEVGRKGPVVIPGVDTEIFRPRAVKKEENTKVVIALGKSGKIKGLNYLFEALKIVSRETKFKLKLILYGGEPSLAKQSPIPTQYVVNPSDESLAELYSMADVAVTASLYESSPLPPLEAMACGTPVVTTRYGTEDYCLNEVNSLVVMPEDSESLAKAILRVIMDENLAEKLKRNGLKTAKEHTWNKTAEKVLQLFQNLKSKAVDN
jgi:glycosyltransferase involved in cell wall biosynthesis